MTDAATTIKIDLAVFASYAVQMILHAKMGPADPTPMYMTDGSAPGAREALWIQWFGMAIFGMSCMIYMNDQAGPSHQQATIKGFLCAYGSSMAFLFYQCFITGAQATLMSQVTCCAVGPALLFLNYNALDKEQGAKATSD